MILRSVVCTYEFTQLHDPEQQHRRPKTTIQKLTIIGEGIRKDRVDTLVGKDLGLISDTINNFYSSTGGHILMSVSEPYEL
jgi:hypothetical protein